MNTADNFTSAAQNVCGNVLQLLSEEGHVGLSDVNALQHCDWRLSLWELDWQMSSIHLQETQVDTWSTFTVESEPTLPQQFQDRRTNRCVFWL